MASQFGSLAFVLGTTYTYTIAMTRGTVQVDGSGSNSLSEIVLASDFTSPAFFSLSRMGNNLILNYSPVPEPAFVTAIFAVGLGGVWWGRRKAAAHRSC